MRKPGNQISFERAKATCFQQFLILLLDSRSYADDLNSPVWDFAVDVSEAQKLGLRTIDLLWMTKKGWIECRGGHSTGESCVNESSKFIILPHGIAVLNEALELVASESFPPSHSGIMTFPHSTQIPNAASIPIWNNHRHELVFSGELIKQFRWPAYNQEKVLCAFEEEGWPERIDDPLPLVPGQDPKRRLGDTIKCLNRNQRRRVIRFRGDGTGEGVIWDIVDSHQLVS